MRESGPGQGGYIPPCPHYPHCYGCPLIHLPYPEQIMRKQRVLAQALATYPSLAHLEVPSLVRSPRRLGYRARAKLVVRREKGRILTGLYAPQSHRVIDISSCPVHPKEINRVVDYLKSQVGALGIVPYDERHGSGQLRYFDLRYSFWRRELVLTLVTRRDLFPEGSALARAVMRKFPFVIGVVQNINESAGNVIWGERFRPLSGRDTLVERIGFLKLRYPPGVFSQVNPPVARKLYETVLSLAALKGNETAIDLYCGVGPISLTLARGCRLVWGADENPLAIATAKQNARMNGIHNCRFFEGDVAEKMKEAKRRLPPLDLVVLNPPRKGVEPGAIDAALSLKARRILYVSCDPATLARDLGLLTREKYRPLGIRPFDMFPQTEEIETVAVLERS